MSGRPGRWGFPTRARSPNRRVLDDSRIWYATTDADTVVDPDWLLRQTGAGTDMVLGVVRIATSRDFPAAAARRYLAAYRSKTGPDSHGHVHGANMGFRADSYWRVGGFAALASGEDVESVAPTAPSTGRSAPSCSARSSAISRRPRGCWHRLRGMLIVAPVALGNDCRCLDRMR